MGQDEPIKKTTAELFGDCVKSINAMRECRQRATSEIMGALKAEGVVVSDAEEYVIPFQISSFPEGFTPERLYLIKQKLGVTDEDYSSVEFLRKESPGMSPEELLGWALSKVRNRLADKMLSDQLPEWELPLHNHEKVLKNNTDIREWNKLVNEWDEINPGYKGYSLPIYVESATENYREGRMTFRK